MTKFRDLRKRLPTRRKLLTAPLPLAANRKGLQNRLRRFTISTKAASAANRGILRKIAILLVSVIVTFPSSPPTAELLPREKPPSKAPPFVINYGKRRHCVMPFPPLFARPALLRKSEPMGLNCCQSHRREKPNAEAATRRMLGFSKTHDFFPRQFAEKSVNKKNLAPSCTAIIRYHMHKGAMMRGSTLLRGKSPLVASGNGGLPRALPRPYQADAYPLTSASGSQRLPLSLLQMMPRFFPLPAAGILHILQYF